MSNEQLLREALPPRPEMREMDYARWGYNADDMDSYGEDCFEAGKRAALAQPAEGGEPLFILHCGQIDSSGEQDEWETEANGQQRVDDFCRLHPGQKIKLYTTQPASKEQAQQPSVTVRYDLSPAMVEGAIRDRLIAMGWTPPLPQPKPQPMTDEQIIDLLLKARRSELESLGIDTEGMRQEAASVGWFLPFARAIEARHGITSDKDET